MTHKVISFSAKPEIHEQIKDHARIRGVATSEAISDLIKKFADTDIDYIQIVIKMPESLKGDKEGLKKWFDSYSKSLVKKYGTPDDIVI